MKKERVILGKNCSYSADSRITGVNNNRVIVGGSGCGKTVSILEPGAFGASESRILQHDRCCDEAASGRQV